MRRGQVQGALVVGTRALQTLTKLRKTWSPKRRIDVIWGYEPWVCEPQVTAACINAVLGVHAVLFCKTCTCLYVYLYLLTGDPLTDTLLYIPFACPPASSSLLRTFPCAQVPPTVFR